jgi:hypothetical protein
MIKLSKLQIASAAALFIVVAFAPGGARADQVFNDDVIITGSLCVGFDCTNGMAFGADTIVLKENNLRIFFDDTSVSSGFPANDWRLIANDSASGGANFFAIEDSTAGRQVFRVSAGARANSIFVSSAGNVGFGTSTPVLLMHGRNSNTPAMRLEQDGSGGFSPYTWDVAGNEANFFVRDVTGGSRLPFRIRPGAPTSSIDIAATGHVGVGTATPTDGALQVSSGSKLGAGNRVDVAFIGTSKSESANPLGLLVTTFGNASVSASRYVNLQATESGAAVNPLVLQQFGGNVGIGATAPTAQLHTTGTVRFAGLANCGSGIMTDGSGNLACITSSQRFKNIAGALSYEVALANVMALRPQVGAYKKTPGVPEHWLIAENVAAVDPALAGFADGKPYTVKTQNVVADLVAVIQYQQREIDGLKQTLAGNAKH